MYTTTARKRVSPVTEAASEAQSRFAMEAMPNSAILPMAGVPSGRPESSSDLGNRIRQRLPGVQERAQAQIATAEQEADRLSASVTSGSPEAVKAAMGRKLGADFSGVRFHTGANDAARAAAKGARAYTSGADIYFGEGGFDPSVAAHELVHTAQQGMVESAVATVSTPVGGIQMEPETQPRRQKRRGLDRVAHTMERLDDKITDKTVGRLARWDKEAIDELHAAKTSGMWDKLSKKQKAAWIARNPVAYGRYKKDAIVRAKAAARVQKRAEQEESVRTFLENFRATNNPKCTLIGDTPAQQAGGAQGNTPTYQVEPADGQFSILGEASEVTDEITEHVGAIASMAQLDELGGAAGLLGDLNSGIRSGAAFFRAIQEGRGADAYDHGVELILTGESAIENIQSFVGDKFEMGGGYNDAINGSKKAIEGVYKAKQGGDQKRAMNGILHNDTFKGRDREELSDEDVLKHDIAVQGRDQGKIMMAAGSGEAIEGILQTGAGIAQMSGAGAVATPVLKAGAFAAKVSTKVATHAMHDNLKGTVTEQTTGIKRDLIKEYLDSQGLDHNEKNIRMAKRAMMRCLGYTTGYREELLADQSAKRAQKIVEGANAGDETYIAIHEGLGGEVDENGRYTIEGLRERLGSEKSREEVVGSVNRIDAMVQQNRRRRIGKEADLRQKLAEKRKALMEAEAMPSNSRTGKQQEKIDKLRKEVQQAAQALGARRDKNAGYGIDADAVGAEVTHREEDAAAKEQATAESARQRRIDKEADLRQKLAEQRKALMEAEATPSNSRTGKQQKKIDKMRKKVQQAAQALSARRDKNAGYGIDADAVGAEVTQREEAARKRRMGKEARLQRRLERQRAALSEYQPGKEMDWMQKKIAKTEEALERRKQKNQAYGYHQ